MSKFQLDECFVEAEAMTYNRFQEEVLKNKSLKDVDENGYCVQWPFSENKTWIDEKSFNKFFAPGDTQLQRMENSVMRLNQKVETFETTIESESFARKSRVMQSIIERQYHVYREELQLLLRRVKDLRATDKALLEFRNEQKQ